MPNIVRLSLGPASTAPHSVAASASATPSASTTPNHARGGRLAVSLASVDVPLQPKVAHAMTKASQADIAAFYLESPHHAGAKFRALENLSLHGAATKAGGKLPFDLSAAQLRLAAAAFVGAGLPGLVEGDHKKQQTDALATWRTLSEEVRLHFASESEQNASLVALFDALAANTHEVCPGPSRETIRPLYAALIHGGLGGLTRALALVAHSKAKSIEARPWAEKVQKERFTRVETSLKQAKKRRLEQGSVPFLARNLRAIRTQSSVGPAVSLDVVARRLSERSADDQQAKMMLARDNRATTPTLSLAPRQESSSPQPASAETTDDTPANISTTPSMQEDDDLAQTLLMVRAEPSMNVQDQAASHPRPDASTQMSRAENTAVGAHENRQRQNSPVARMASSESAASSLQTGSGSELSYLEARAALLAQHNPVRPTSPVARTVAQQTPPPASESAPAPEAPRPGPERRVSQLAHQTASRFRATASLPIVEHRAPAEPLPPPAERLQRVHFALLGDVVLTTATLSALLLPRTANVARPEHVQVQINGRHVATHLWMLHAMIHPDPRVGAGVGVLGGISCALGQVSMPLALLGRLLAPPSGGFQDVMHPGVNINGIPLSISLRLLRELMDDAQEQDAPSRQDDN